MSSMGVGAWFSRFIDDELERAFVILQMIIALVGGFSAFILFYAFAYIGNYEAFLYLITILLGSMLGVEIPLVIRILKSSFSLKTNISNVFTVDYIGALFASLLFPLVLLPQLGVMQTGFFLGMLNLMVASIALSIFWQQLGYRYLLYILSIAIVLILGFINANSLTDMIEKKLYRFPIIYSQQTPYQKITLTAQKGRVQFYINGAIQFDSIDEYRYHESLVHPVMNMSKSRENILIIGGGDGMALREVVKYPRVKEITLVDLDPQITKLFSTNTTLKKLNNNSFDDSRVTVINQDAWKFIENSHRLYDVIIIDLPDPNNISLSRLYSQSFYRLLSSHLSRAGALVSQSTSPMFSREAFWSIAKTMQSAELITTAYHTYVPSFGEWGFVLASKLNLPLDRLNLPKGLKYLDEDTLKSALFFDKDLSKVIVEPNRLSDHKLIYYYNNGWDKWYAK